MEDRPNYEVYTLDELKTALEKLDENTDPSEVEQINALIEKGGYTPPPPDLNGLGGWLILVGIGVVISPFRLLYELVPMYSGLISNNTFGILLSPDSGYYHPFIAMFVGLEALLNLAMLAGSGYLLYLFFSRHYLFPKLYIALAVASILILVLDAVIAANLLPSMEVFTGEWFGDLTRTLVAAMIWIPYMLVSKRVKATFVREQPEA